MSYTFPAQRLLPGDHVKVKGKVETYEVVDYGINWAGFDEDLERKPFICLRPIVTEFHLLENLEMVFNPDTHVGIPLDLWGSDLGRTPKRVRQEQSG